MALLALVAEEPSHGYELRAEFDRRTGGAWPLNIGQVYTTLQRLERDGLVVSDEPTPEGQVVYQATAAGIEAVQHWYSETPEREAPARNELAMQLSIAAQSPDVDVRDVITKQRTAALRALRDLTQLKAGGRSSSEPASSLGWSLALDALVFQTEAEIKWLDHVEAQLVAASRHRRKVARSSPSDDRAVAGVRGKR